MIGWHTIICTPLYHCWCGNGHLNNFTSLSLSLSFFPPLSLQHRPWLHIHTPSPPPQQLLLPSHLHPTLRHLIFHLRWHKHFLLCNIATTIYNTTSSSLLPHHHRLDLELRRLLWFTTVIVASGWGSSVNTVQVTSTIQNGPIEDRTNSRWTRWDREHKWWERHDEMRRKEGRRRPVTEVGVE